MLHRILLATCLVVLYVDPAQAKKIILPQVVTDPAWDTTIRVLNRDDDDRAITGTFYKSDGTPWDNLDLSYFFSGTSETDADGQFTFGTPGFGVTRWTTFPRDETTRVGYLVLDTNSELTKLSGFLSYRREGEEVTNRVGLLSAPLATWVSLPFDSDTAIAIVNPEDDTIFVSVQLIFQEFTSDQKEDVIKLELRPRHQASFFLKNLSSVDEEYDDFYLGHANVWTQDGSAEFAAMSLRFPSSGVFTSVPVHVIKDSPFNEIVPTPTIQTIKPGEPESVLFWDVQEVHFRVRVPEGASMLSVRYIFDPPDFGLLQASHGELPRVRQRDGQLIFPPCDDGDTGGEVSCAVPNPEPGDWFIEIYNNNQYSDGSISVEIN